MPEALAPGGARSCHPGTAGVGAVGVGAVGHSCLMAQHIVYAPSERPLAEALVEGRWVPAEVRMWVQHDDGRWTADVGFSPSAAENRIGTFTADQLRPVDGVSWSAPPP